jgi:HAE1 family hydrophobic/amphiphilic exporter-1
MISIVVVGIICFKKIDVDLFPNVKIPTIYIATNYGNSNPSEVETLITKPIEDEISSISHIKTITSKSLKGVSQIIVNFYDDVDIKYAENQVRDRVNQALIKLPKDVNTPIIRRIDPSEQPIATIAIIQNNEKKLSTAELFDIANNTVKPTLEQVSNVGLVEIIGGRKREVSVLLDNNLLKSRNISLTQVRQKLTESGRNTPIGKINTGSAEKLFSASSQFADIAEIENTLVNFYSDEVPTKISNIGKVVDDLEDEKSRAFVDGKSALLLDVYRQSDSNIVKVVYDLTAKITNINDDFLKNRTPLKALLVKDSSIVIKNNISDVYYTIIIAIFLTIVTIFLFLKNIRATLIVAVSIPIALISSFIAIYLANFSINVISLLAISLAIGLLVDDAIVVVENVHKKIESGIDPVRSAMEGTKEILMAIVAITLVLVATFLPIGFMNGIVGQYMKQFGFTMAFSMVVSLFVAITIIPVLCAYFSKNKPPHAFSHKGLQALEKYALSAKLLYEKILFQSLKNPKKILIISFFVFVLSISTIFFIPKTFVPEGDNGEVSIITDFPPDSSIDFSNKTAYEMYEIMRKNDEIELVVISVGSRFGQTNNSNFYVKLKSERKITTAQFKEKLRQQLKDFSFVNPVIKDYDPSAGSSRTQPFNIYLTSNNVSLLNEYGKLLLQKLTDGKSLKDLDSSEKNVRNELKIKMKNDSARKYGVNPQAVGEELRGFVEGFTTTKFYQNDASYDVRVRLKENQRNLEENFYKLFVPNINKKMVKLSDVGYLESSLESATINRQNRSRYVQITASLAPKIGLLNVINGVEKKIDSDKNNGYNEISYNFDGDSKNMKDMISSFKIAMLIAFLFIYLILASLYESFITPITILISMPLAFCGAFFALFITNQSINIFAILGLFILIGISCKNSILIVDFASKMVSSGRSRESAIIEAAMTRLRPILMTSLAIIVGTIPVAIGLFTASKPRVSMGIGIIGGMIFSTILTLVIVPSIFIYVDRLRVFLRNFPKKYKQ